MRRERWHPCQPEHLRLRRTLRPVVSPQPQLLMTEPKTAKLRHSLRVTRQGALPTSGGSVRMNGSWGNVLRWRGGVSVRLGSGRFGQHRGLESTRELSHSLATAWASRRKGVETGRFRARKHRLSWGQRRQLFHRTFPRMSRPHPHKPVGWLGQRL